MSAIATLVAAMGLLPSGSFSLPRQANPRGGVIIQRSPPNTRRSAVAGLLSVFIAFDSAVAFDNGIPEMAESRERARERGWSTYAGTQPPLGLQGNSKLATCGFEPHCFSTSGDADHLLKLWRPKVASNPMVELLETVKAYPPFQARIDGGGFKILTADANYLYVQFESLRKGFVDDVEFAVNKDGGVQVRSSSRLGFLDLGVNAKRLNWISARLRDKGWTAPAILEEDYPDYFQQINFTYDNYIRSVLSPETCASPTDVLNCLDPITAK